MHFGETCVRLGLIGLKLGEIPGNIRRRIEQADADTFLAWSAHIPTVERIEDAIH